MHPVKKLICRAVQLLFRIAQPILPYKDPCVLDSTGEIIPVLKEQGIESVLLVTDAYIRGVEMTKALEQRLWNNDIRCYVYDGVCPNPTVDNVEEALAKHAAAEANPLYSVPILMDAQELERFYYMVMESEHKEGTNHEETKQAA